MESEVIEIDEVMEEEEDDEGEQKEDKEVDADNESLLSDLQSVTGESAKKAAKKAAGIDNFKKVFIEMFPDVLTTGVFIFIDYQNDNNIITSNDELRLQFGESFFASLFPVPS